MTIKTIIFDLDNTLYDYYKFSNKSLIKVYKVLKKERKISKEKFIRTFNQSKKEVRKGLENSPDSHDRIIYFQQMGEKLNLNLTLMLKLYNTYYTSFLKYIKPRKGVLKTFKKIKRRGLKIIILTNEVVEIQLRKINKMGLLKYADYFIASEDVGIDKPSKKIFLYALKKASAKPDETIMVGDDEKADIYGAKKVKIKNILLTNNKNKKTKADFTITKIPEVLKILDNLK